MTGRTVPEPIMASTANRADPALRVLLVGPRGHGGEDVYVQTLRTCPPDGVEYVDAGSFHASAPGARCRVLEEVFLNRVIHPWLIPDIGFRSLTLGAEFDLVHVHAHPIRLGRLRSTPLVMSEGSSSAVYLKEYLNWDEQTMNRGYARARRVYRGLGVHDRLLNLRRVSRAYVFSRWARDVNIRWGADPAKLDVVYPGFPTPPPVEPRERRDFRFLFIGTDFERKGGFEVIEAFESVAARRAEVKLILVTPDPRLPHPDRAIHSWVPAERRERLLALLQALERRGRVERYTLQDRTWLYRRFYRSADVFVMPSRAEGFGFTNVEALSFGLPVISSRTGPIAEVIEDGVTGVLVPPGDASALAAAMERVVAESDTVTRMGQAARATFLARFTLDDFQRRLMQVYGRAMENPCVGS